MRETLRYWATLLVLVVLVGVGLVVVATSGFTAKGIVGLVVALVSVALLFSYSRSVRTKRHATPMPR